MYVPDYFKPDPATVGELLRNMGAADLVTATPQGLRATFLPMVFVAGDRSTGEPDRLLGHVARKNEQWRLPVIGDALAIVRGPDAYITPSWYATKRDHGRVVPTWNYITAHVYGSLVIHEDGAWLATNVAALTTKYETGRQEPWAVTDAPPEYVTGQLRAIVGVELVVSRVEAKFKLSQNRSDADIDGVVAGLSEDEFQAEMAEAVHAAKPAR